MTGLAPGVWGWLLVAACGPSSGSRSNFNANGVPESVLRGEAAADAPQDAAGDEPEPTETTVTSPRALDTAEAWSASPLLGPYASLEQYCSRRRARLVAEFGNDFSVPEDVGCQPIGQPVHRLTGRISAIQWLTVKLNDPDQTRNALAMRTVAGWYVEERATAGAIELSQLVPGDDPELIVRGESSKEVCGGCDTVEVKSVYFCGVGVSTIPSCTRQVKLSSTLDSTELWWRLDDRQHVVFEGTIAVASIAEQREAHDVLTRPHRLQFP